MPLGHGPFVAQLAGGLDGDDQVESRSVAGFDEERRLEHDDVFGPGCDLLEASPHQGMNRRLQGEARLRIAEDASGDLGVVHATPLVQHLGAEEGAHRRGAFAPRAVELRHQTVGVDHLESRLAQPGRHRRLAAGEPAGEADAESAGAHDAGSPCRRRAAFRVLARTMATVSGPTPPGTGVIAAALGATRVKSTSPTRV